MIQFPISCGYLQMKLPLHFAFTFTLWEKIHSSERHLKGILFCSKKKKVTHTSSLVTNMEEQLYYIHLQFKNKHCHQRMPISRLDERSLNVRQ